MIGIWMFFTGLAMLFIGFPVAFTFGAVAVFFGMAAGIIEAFNDGELLICLLYTSPSPRDQRGSRMPSSA